MAHLRRAHLVTATATLLVVGTTAAATGAVSPDYTVDLSMTSAAQLFEGSPVLIDGVDVGEVSNLATENGVAIATIRLDDDHAPLREGTTTRVEWLSVLGERVVTVLPGPLENPEIPSGALYEAESTQIEVDQVLAALDEPTRERLTSLVGRLDATLEDREPDLRETLRTGGPAVRALGEVMAAVGRDGDAIRALITQLSDVTATVGARQQEVGSVVTDLAAFTGSVAEQQENLSEALGELPPTLREAVGTLDMVPAAADEVVPLLTDLRPATERLPAAAQKLGPVLTDLRPVVRDLRPTLVAADALLARTPGLLDESHAVLPPVGQAIEGFGPAVSYLRPWTPEAVGWITNWGQAFAGYDSQGHVWSAFLSAGPSAFDDSATMPPGLARSDNPVPGESSGQSWTDAHGNGMR